MSRRAYAGLVNHLRKTKPEPIKSFAELPKLLNQTGESTMEEAQQQLPLEVALGAFLETTEFKQGVPPVPGWWDARLVSAAAKTGTNVVNRRWWDGVHWSWPTNVGETEEETQHAKSKVSRYGLTEIEYRGLKSPAPSEYFK